MDAYLGLLLVLEMQEDEDRREVERPLGANCVNPWGLSANKFVAMFRLSKLLAQNLIEELSPSLPRQTRLSAIPKDRRVLIALRIFATGSYQLAVATDCTLGVSQATVSRCNKQVCHAIVERLAQRWVKFPRTPVEQIAVKRGFWTKYQFPGVLGAVDGTHVAIVPPPVNDPDFPEHAYVNWKNFHSINVQVVCDAERNILALSARYPGRSHDSFVWRNSSVRRYLSQDYDNGNTTSWVLDSAYPLEPWLMTPFEQTEEGSPEETYNRRQSKGRSVVECTIGLLKQRWRCLLKDRVLHYRPTAASNIINSCAVLHNICVFNNLPIVEEVGEPVFEFEEEGNVEAEERRGNRLATAGQRIRNAIVRRHFRNVRAAE